MSDFESLGLRGGIWQAVLRRETPPVRVLLVHQGMRLADARVISDGDGVWRIAAAIPADRLSDGVQSFLLMEDGAAEGEMRPDALHLGSLNLLAGEVLDHDLLVEITLLRSELELVKKELRRLAAQHG